MVRNTIVYQLHTSKRENKKSSAGTFTYNSTLNINYFLLKLDFELFKNVLQTISKPNLRINKILNVAHLGDQKYIVTSVNYFLILETTN